MNLKKLSRIPTWEWPGDAGDSILKILTDREARYAERLLAAEMAGDYTVINDAIATALLAVIGSGEEREELRGQAAISFGPALEDADTSDFQDESDCVISEAMFTRIQKELRRLSADAAVPKLVRRRVLEASVRAPQEWHESAVATAYRSRDPEWELTAVFCMRFVRGFDSQILEALESRDRQIQYEAVLAAGTWEVEAAWPHIESILTGKTRDRNLVLAAIEAAAGMPYDKAVEVLYTLADSDNEEFAEAAHDTLAMMRTGSTQQDEDEFDDDLDYGEAAGYDETEDEDDEFDEDFEYEDEEDELDDELEGDEEEDEDGRER